MRPEPQVLASPHLGQKWIHTPMVTHPTAALITGTLASRHAWLASVAAPGPGGAGRQLEDVSRALSRRLAGFIRTNNSSC